MADPSKVRFDTDGSAGRSVALITGANKGIGFATARQLAARGLHVLLGSRSAENAARAVATLEADGLAAQPITIDVCDDGSVQDAADLIAAQFGRLNVLINNAGILVRKHALDVTADDACREFETNVFGAIRVIHAMLPLLRRAEAPRIVNVSSDSAMFANATDSGSMFARSHDSFVYSASKAAVNMVTVKYANAFRDDPDTAHVKINAVTPGYVATDLNAFQGVRTIDEGARAAVQWATAGTDAPSGGFFNEEGPLPW
jgi:NAD(P)-dependent dehydrogenase (short-subunit alcohol dehydrogenase family)